MDSDDARQRAVDNESAVKDERAANRESAVGDERADGSESADTRKRAVSPESASATERAVATESAGQEERAAIAEGAVDHERAALPESTEPAERADTCESAEDTEPRHRSGYPQIANATHHLWDAQQDGWPDHLPHEAWRELVQILNDEKPAKGRSDDHPAFQPDYAPNYLATPIDPVPEAPPAPGTKARR